MYALHCAVVGKSFAWRDHSSAPVSMRVTFQGNRTMVIQGDGEFVEDETEWRVVSLNGQIRVAVWGNSHVLKFLSDDCSVFECVPGVGPANHGQIGSAITLS